MAYQDHRDDSRYRRQQPSPERRRRSQAEPDRPYQRAVSRPAPQSSSSRQTPRPASSRRPSGRSDMQDPASRPRRDSVRGAAGRDSARGTTARDSSRPRPSARQRTSTQRVATPSYEGHTSAPRQRRSGRDVYVTPSPNRGGARNWVAIVAGALALLLVAFVVVKIPGMISAPKEMTAEEKAAAAEAAAKAEAERQAAIDAAATPVSFTISFTGDNTLGNDINFGYEGRLPQYYDENGPHYFYENVKHIFDADDYTVVDMEGVLTTSDDRSGNFFAFKADPEYVEILKYGGVEAATLANNHSHDYYDDGYNDTWKTLESNGIVPFGYDDIAYVDIKGVKVALIGIYELDEYLGIMDNMLENIKKAKDNGAVLTIVFQHWGEEKMYVPDTDQVTLGHAAIDAGADLVIGCHPHRVQGIEKYNGRYIAYSMGNFCFGGNNAPADMDCYIFQQTFTVRGKTVEMNDNINVIPCSISSVDGYNNYQPTPATGEEADRIMAKIDEISQEIPQL